MLKMSQTKTLANALVAMSTRALWPWRLLVWWLMLVEAMFVVSLMQEIVTQWWLEILEPSNGARVLPGAEVRFRVGERSTPVRVEEMRARFEVVIDSTTRELSVELDGDVALEVEQFSREVGLSDANGLVLATTANAVVRQARGASYARRVCFELRASLSRLVGRWCASESDWASQPLSLPLEEGESYELLCSGADFPGSRAVGPYTARERVRFVASSIACKPPVVRRPRSGSVVDAMVAHIDVISDGTPCVRVDNGQTTCARGRRLKHTFGPLVPGRHRLKVWDNCSSVSIDFEARVGWNERVALARAIPPLQLVTAVSQRYVDQRILHNLVGSLHYWEPTATLVVYDLGLSEPARALLSTWRRVSLELVADAANRILGHVPPHVLDSASYAFKAIVIADALRNAGSILWLDANAEVRRPLDDVALLVAETGHFLVEHPYRFPTAQFHHPNAVAYHGCSASDFSRAHCATTFVGATARGFFANKVLPRLVNCSVEPGCINPPGSSRANNRQEQTALNAILCRFGTPPDGFCSNELRFRLTSDFENDNTPSQPTTDETDWNYQVLYTRRNHPIKPYLRFVQIRP